MDVAHAAVGVGHLAAQARRRRRSAAPDDRRTRACVPAGRRPLSTAPAEPERGPAAPSESSSANSAAPGHAVGNVLLENVVQGRQGERRHGFGLLPLVSAICARDSRPRPRGPGGWRCGCARIPRLPPRRPESAGPTASPSGWPPPGCGATSARDARPGRAAGADRPVVEESLPDRPPTLPPTR